MNHTWKGVAVSEKLSLFWSDLQSANERFHLAELEEIITIFLEPQALTVLSIITIICVLCSYILSREVKSTHLLLFVEALAVIVVFLPFFLPYKGFRMLFGLVVFAAGMSIHSRVCEELQREKLKKEDLAQQIKSPLIRFWVELFNTYYFNLFSKLETSKSARFPTFPEILYFFMVITNSDICTYLIKEWIPENISGTNQGFAQALVGGVWVLFAMQYTYQNLTILFRLVGRPLPLELTHFHPLLSVSVSEFWGVRWNPVIGKQLQESFYKPLRVVKVPRHLCVLACFTGSALLHAVPQFNSTRDPADTLMMFSFFFLQGVCLLLEFGLQQLCGLHSHPEAPGTLTPNTSVADKMSSADGAPTKTDKVTLRHQAAVEHAYRVKTANHQTFTELLTISAILSLLYFSVEGVWTRESAALVVSLWVGSLTGFHAVRSQVAPLETKNVFMFLRTVVGWLLTVGSVVLMLPLFSVPILNAIEEIFCRSYFVGSFFRAVLN